VPEKQQLATVSAPPWKNQKCSMCKYETVDISIKYPIPGQSTPMLKGCMYMFDIVDNAFRYGRAFIIWQFVQKSSKVKESSMHVI